MPEWLLPAARIALRFGGPAAILSELLVPTPAGGKHHEGAIPGRPDLRYSWNEDETLLEIKRASDEQTILAAKASDHGTFRDKDGRIVARLIGNEVTVDPSDFFPKKDAGPSDNDDDPNFCPAPGKDKAGRPGKKGEPDRDYEDYVKSFVNPPPNTTPRAMGYQLPNPEENGALVNYDDCQRKTGTLVEAKGRTYSRLLALQPQPAAGTIFKMLKQATNQINASQGRDVVWFFAEEGAAAEARKLFDGDPKLKRIQVIYLPMPGWSR